MADFFHRPSPKSVCKSAQNWTWNLGVPLSLLYPSHIPHPKPLRRPLCPSDLHPIHTYVDRAGWVHLSVIRAKMGSGSSCRTSSPTGKSRQRLGRRNATEILLASVPAPHPLASGTHRCRLLHCGASPLLTNPAAPWSLREAGPPWWLGPLWSREEHA